MSLQYPRGGAQKNQTRRSQLVRKVYLCWERPGSPNGVQWLWSPRPSRCGNAMIPGSPFSSERSARHEARDLLGRLSNPHNRPPCEVDPSQPHCTDERVEALGQGRVMQVTADSVHFPQIPPSTGLLPASLAAFFRLSRTDRVPQGRTTSFLLPNCPQPPT